MTEPTLERAVHTASILVVDDHASNVEMLSGLLDVGGFSNVFGTTDAIQGLAMAEVGSYDLVLLDMRMPKLDGIEFIRRLRAHDAADRPAIIVLTAQTDDETRRNALNAGARDFITKPFKLWELLQRVRNALEIQILYRRTRQLNDELEERVVVRTAELKDTRADVIRRLSAAAEFRDNETGQHIARMSVFAHHLALKLGLPEAEAVNIRDAAPLHDIGKIGIPDAILLKRGRLDAAEWEIMKRHAEIGGQILVGGKSPLLTLARTIALSHHEKWDGSGYPRGLKGEAIPIAGRIVAVSDVFDALTSERPYKPAWSVDDAVAYMLEVSGSHLDPALVGLFHRELPAILTFRERFRDQAASATAHA